MRGRMTARSRRGTGAKRAGLALGLVLATACSPIYRNHGYTPTDDALSQIVVGVDTRASVEEVVGTPSSAGILDDSGYYYVSQRMRTVAYRAPEIVDREVVAISFDDAGVVTNVERFGLERGNVVAFSRRVTESNVQGISFLRQLFGSLGRFNAADLFQREGR